MTLSFVKISAASFCLLLHVLSSLTILMSSLPSKMVESGNGVLKSSSAVSWFDFVNSPEGVFSSLRPIDFVAFSFLNILAVDANELSSSTWLCQAFLFSFLIVVLYLFLSSLYSALPLPLMHNVSLTNSLRAFISGFHQGLSSDLVLWVVVANL